MSNYITDEQYRLIQKLRKSETIEELILQFENIVNIFTQGKIMVKIKSLKIAWFNVVSNSHQSPENGVKNFSRYNNLPLGYTGFSGSIEYSHQGDSWLTLCAIFEKCRIFTGTGGAGLYEVRIFIDDFPFLERQELMLAALSNNSCSFNKTFT